MRVEGSLVGRKITSLGEKGLCCLLFGTDVSLRINPHDDRLPWSQIFIVKRMNLRFFLNSLIYWDFVQNIFACLSDPVISLLMHV